MSGGWSRFGAWALLAAGLLGWEFSARALQLSALVLPPPSAVLSALWQGLRSGYLWPHIGQTVLELVLGLTAGCALGLVSGVALGESAGLRRLLMPYVVTSQVVPKLALAPLFIVWFGFGMTSTVVITALICFFPLMENTMTGIAQVDARRLELFRMLGATRWQTLLRLKIPSGLPGIMAGFRVAVVLALVGAVVGEFIGGSQGLGALIIASQGMMDTPLMFAVLVLITGLGLLLYQLAITLEKRLLESRMTTLQKEIEK
ncbi:MAG: ABC transporter permease [Polaromonas sp.]|uniref:ABC transporter permease n=1 Tax=Polaromonas sp. TaxID=1869339 RepID=UPI0027311898|nr:ABC transporter permease [Polaromonas sp.]MDP2256295.1 ABC transporter permease [Polaromonas sp.]MDP3707615.1 ABC transporter permease [Polaromonas sp.]